MATNDGLVLDVSTKQLMAAVVPRSTRFLTIFLIAGYMIRILTHLHVGDTILVGALLLLIFWPLFTEFRKGMRLERLVKSDSRPALEINPRRMSGSIAMLDGKRREKMLAANQARFVIPWDDVVNVYIRPSFKAGRIYRPAVLSIAVRDDFEPNNQYNLRRELFQDCEQELIDYIEQMSGVRVIEKRNAYVDDRRSRSTREIANSTRPRSTRQFAGSAR